MPAELQTRLLRVLSDGTFLGPREIKMLRTVPELVFVNCCYLAARNTDQLFQEDGLLNPRYDRPQFAATIAEVDGLTRYGAKINVFMLGEDPGLQRFMDAVARRYGGRVFTPSPDRLGDYLVSDYLRARSRGRRRFA